MVANVGLFFDTDFILSVSLSSLLCDSKVEPRGSSMVEKGTGVNSEDRIVLVVVMAIQWEEPQVTRVILLCNMLAFVGTDITKLVEPAC